MRALFLVVPAALSAGCMTPASFDGGEGSGSVLSTVGADPASYRVDGVVAVERVRTIDGAQTSVGAKFMRHGGLPEAAERLVGSRLLLPSTGECASIAELEDSDAEITGGGASELDGEVELIDVGDVSLVTDLAPRDASLFGPEAFALTTGSTTSGKTFVVRLAPRAFPDVGELVSGVFYSSPDLGAPLPAPGRYAIEGSGAAAAAPFELDAEAPEDPGEVLIDGSDLVSGAMAKRGSDLLISWSSDDRGAASRDRVYVDIQAADGQVHRCAFEDDGAAIVPGSLITAPSVAIAVHRLRESTLPLGAGSRLQGARITASDTDDGAGRVVIRFDLAVVGRVTVGARGGLGSLGYGSLADASGG